MKKKTLNQQLGFTPVIKENTGIISETSWVSNPSNRYSPYAKSEPTPLPYYLAPREPLEAEDRPLHPLWVVPIAALMITSLVIGFCYGSVMG